MRYADLVGRLPPALRRHCVSQRHAQYTSIEHDTWRRLTHELRATLDGRTCTDLGTAYARTGMNFEHIPTIEALNESLGSYGWQAVVVIGFIPPGDFMAFQARQVLPISRAMRPPEQAHYTPAPDILHEAAGHVPMLCVTEYRDFLCRLGRLGAHASPHAADQPLFAAQRRLSDLMARPFVAPSAIAAATASLERARANARRFPASPATLVARFHWWTVEYGLIGPAESIYGAGLLSSVRESKAVAAVPKRPMSIDCCQYDYDISHPQPFLYVADDWGHLERVLEELEDRVNGLETSPVRAFSTGTVVN